MKSISYLLLAASVATLVLSLVTKFSALKMIGKIGPTGYLLATMALLLIAANAALIELLKK